MRAFPKPRCSRGENPVERLGEFIREYCRRNRGGALPALVVMGFPATLDATRRRVLQAPNIPGLDGLSAKALEEELGVAVVFEKDVNLLFYCDMEDLRIPGRGLAVGVYVGTGIGNALFYDGKPLTGKNGVSGELGHIPRSGSRQVCGCGNKGCAECYGSGRRLIEIREGFFPETSISRLFAEQWPAPALEEFVEEIACTVAAEVNILDPDYLVLGGGVLNMDGFPIFNLSERILAHTRKPYPAESLEILHSPDGVENGVRGALALGWRITEQGNKGGKI